MTADGGGAFHLAFLPDRPTPRFFVWGRGAAASALATCGGRATALVVDETLAPRELEGIAIPLLEALPRLAALTASETDRAPASIAAWSQAGGAIGSQGGPAAANVGAAVSIGRVPFGRGHAPTRPRTGHDYPD